MIIIGIATLSHELPTAPTGYRRCRPQAYARGRNVSGLGYPDGNGNTVTLNPDGWWTLHTPTSDVTNYGPFYSQHQGVQGPGQGGTLTQQLIDAAGQRSPLWTWQGNSGLTVTKGPDGTLGQTDPDGSTITQTSTGVVTQTNPDGSRR